MAWVVAQDRIVLEDNIAVDLGFRITQGDRSERTRAFAYTEGGSATPGDLSLLASYSYIIAD